MKDIEAPTDAACRYATAYEAHYTAKDLRKALDLYKVLVPRSRSITLGDVGTLLRTAWHVGVRAPHRRRFWRLMLKALAKGGGHLREAVAHAVQGEHLILYIRDDLTPRMERACGDARAPVPRTAGGVLWSAGSLGQVR